MAAKSEGCVSRASFEPRRAQPTAVQYVPRAIRGANEPGDAATHASSGGASSFSAL